MEGMGKEFMTRQKEWNETACGNGQKHEQANRKA
jgi:hypothetical protein